MSNKKPLPFRIRALDNLIKRRLEKTAIQDNDAGLTGMQYGFLGYLGEHANEDVFQRDIEAQFNIRRSTATGMLQLMEKNGLIERVSVPEDARLKKIVITDKARQLDQKAKDNVDRLEEQLLRGISTRELEQFYCTLEKISKNAQE